jgi:hypothetical protein
VEGRYETEFFHCLGCKVMFLEPELFTAAPAFLTEQQERSRGPEGDTLGAPQEALRSQALRSRLWIARARRERGGWEPTAEEVLRMRNRYRQ